MRTVHSISAGAGNFFAKLATNYVYEVSRDYGLELATRVTLGFSSVSAPDTDNQVV